MIDDGMVMVELCTVLHWCWRYGLVMNDYTVSGFLHDHRAYYVVAEGIEGFYSFHSLWYVVETLPFAVSEQCSLMGTALPPVRLSLADHDLRSATCTYVASLHALATFSLVPHSYLDSLLCSALPLRCTGLGLPC